jgi:hypothetical protein
MTTTDWILDVVLVLIVVRQVREARLGPRSILLPFVIVGWAAKHYLHSIPTGGSDLLLIGALAALGVLLGVLGAVFTRVRADGGRHPLVKAGVVAAALWVGSMGARLGFAVWASHGGGPAIARFSVAHHLDARAWTAALILMALGEVVARMGLIYLRGRRAVADYRAPLAEVPARRPVG